MAIKVTRGPALTGERTLNEYGVALDPSPGAPAYNVFGVTLRFLMNAGGQGRTEVHVDIGPEDFTALAQAMMNADPEIAAKAFGAALLKGCQLVDDDPTTW